MLGDGIIDYMDNHFGKHVEVNIIFYHKLITKFMQHTDLFEKSRVLMMPKVKAWVIKDFGQKNIEAIKKQCEDKDYGLVTIYNEDQIYYRNEEIQTVSTGSHWFLLDDLLNPQKE